MAASVEGTESSGRDIGTVLSLHLAVTRDSVLQIANSSAEAGQLLQKVQEYFDEQTKREIKWRADMTSLRRARVNAEQQFSQLEKQLITCSAKLDAETKQNEKLNAEFVETSTSLAEKQKRLQEVEGIKEDASTNYSRVSKFNEQLEAEKLELLSLVERKNQEIDSLNGEWKTMSEKLSSANSAKCKAEANLDEIQSQGTSFMYREKRMEQEKELLKKQSDWLNGELKKKTEDLATIRKDKSSQILELQSQLDESNEELSHLKLSTGDLKQNHGELEKKVESFMERLKEARDQLVKSEEYYKMELSSQSKLADLYKDEAEESRKKSRDMLTAMEELQKLLKEASDACLDTESRMQEQENSSRETVKDLEIKIVQLEKELENANDLLQAARQRGAAPMTAASLSAMSPTAAATSSLLKSGMTLTQIYSQYVEVSDSLQQEKDENVRLKNYLDQILQEIEEKAPVLQQQRYDYESALHSVDQLTRRLDTALVDHEQLTVEEEESKKLSNHLKRENERLKTLNADLSQQVQVLLKECEEARGGIVSTTSTSGSEVSSSSQVISKHLVTFKSIEELQHQNQKLLVVIRDLSEEKEKREEDGADHVLTELKAQLDLSLKEVENMKEARSRQMSMVEAVVRQRDMYRVLLANTGQSPIPIPIGVPSMLGVLPSTPSKSVVNMEETKAALKELQKHFTEYRAEKKQDEEKLTVKFEKQLTDNTHLLGENAKLKSQLEFSEERYKMLQSNSEGFKKEASAASEKALKLNLANAKMQLYLESVQQELACVKDKMNKAQVMCENLTAEKDMLRDSEIRLLQENKTILEQHKDQAVLLTNLQSLQNKLERSEFNTRTRLEAQLEALQKEATLAKRKLEAEESHHKNIIRTLENRVQELRTQMDTEARSNQQARDMLVSNTKNMENLESKCAEAKAQLEAAEKRLEDVLTREPSPEEDIEKTRKDLQEKYNVLLQDADLKFKDAEAKAQGLEEQLQQAKIHTEQFKSISAANEEALRDLNKTSDEFKNNMESRLKTAEEQTSYLQGQIQGLESRNNALTLENSRVKREAERQTKELQEILSTIRKELEDSRMRTRSATANELVSREELKEQAKLASECQEKYERELLLHSNDVQALAATKEQLKQHNSKVTEVTDRAAAAEEKLKGSLASWEERKKQHDTAIKKLEARCADLVNQNSTLHRELDKLVNQMASTKSVPTSSGEGTSGEGGKSVEELWEIIRFIRREKEIAETKSELAQTESVRYQQRSEYLEKQLKNALENLKEEKSQTQVDVQTSAQYAEVMEKVKKMNEVTQANKVLSDEKQKMDQKLKVQELKIKKLESEIQPMKESNRSVTAMKDSLVAEKTALKNEIMRWTSRTNQLLEQYKNVDLEEYKRMTEEKKQFQQHIANLKSENQRTKTDLAKTQGELSSSKIEYQKAMEQVDAVKAQTKSDDGKNQQEVSALKKSVEEKTEEINDKIKTLNQVKRIARRYKSQFDDQAKELNELKKKVEEQLQQPDAATAATLAAAQPTPGVDVSSYETQIKELTHQVQNLEEQMKTSKEAEEQSKARMKEKGLTQAQMKEKEEKSKKVLIQAREKIQQLTSLKDKLGSENEDVKKTAKAAIDAKESLSRRSKELEMRLEVLQSQYDGRLAKLEKELNDAIANKDKIAENNKKQTEELQQKQKTEVDQLQQRVQQQQKQIQQQQMKLTSLTPSVNNATRLQGDTPGADNVQTQEPSSVSTSVTPVSTVPPTATIKPTTTPTVIKPASAKTASIRPMAITQATPTPTATVLPTVTATVQEIVTTSTAIVPPRGQAFVVSTSSMSTTVPVRPITSGAAAHVLAGSNTAAAAATVEAQAVRVVPTLDQMPVITAVTTGGKRQRDEEEDPGRAPNQGQGQQPIVKKIKTTETESTPGRQVSEPKDKEEDDCQEEGTWEVPEVEMGPSGRDTPEIVLIESDDEEVEEDEEESEADMEEEEEEEVEVYEEDMMEEDGDGDEVEGEEDYDEDIGEEEDEEGVATTEGVDIVEVIDDDEEEVEPEENTEQELEQNIEEGVEEQEDLGDEEEEEEGQAATKEQEAAVTGIIEETSSSQPDVPDVDEVQREVAGVTQGVVPTVTTGQFVQQQDEPSPAGRSVTSDRPGRLRSHLAPFSFPPGQSAPGPFDEADDCTVPSTPTLFVPKRTDGFAEAISSPHIHRPFNFAPPNEGNSSVMQTLGLESSISEGGLRVDDTHVDLMEDTAEENTNRTPFSIVTESGESSSQTVPVRAQSRGSESTSRQHSLESLESEGDFTADVTSVTDIPSITVTPATERTADEAAEQNVPVAQETSASLEQEVIELTEGDEGTGEGDEDGRDCQLEDELELTQDDDKQSDSSQAAAESASCSQEQALAVESQPSTSTDDASTAQDSSKGSVIQLKRSGTMSTGQRGAARQAHRGTVPTHAGRARRIKRFTPGRGGARGRSTGYRRGGGSGAGAS